MRPSASDLIMKIRPRGESISVPGSENVGQYARQSPQWTHWLTPSTDSPCRLSGPVAAGRGAGGGGIHGAGSFNGAKKRAPTARVAGVGAGGLAAVRRT